MMEVMDLMNILNAPKIEQHKLQKRLEGIKAAIAA